MGNVEERRVIISAWRGHVFIHVHNAHRPCLVVLGTVRVRVYIGCLRGA